jgi:CHAT domain-containing protein
MLYRIFLLILLVVSYCLLSQTANKTLLEAQKKLELYDAPTAKILCKKVENTIKLNTPDFYLYHQIMAKSEALSGNYQTALSLWDKGNKDKSTPAYHYFRINALKDFGDYKTAYEEVYQWQQLEKRRNTADYITATLLLVQLNRLTGRYNESKPALEEIKKLTQELYGTQHEVYYQLLSEFALHHKQMNEYKLAESYFMLLLPYFREENSILYATMLAELSNMYMQMGSYERSTEMIQKAEERILNTKYVPLSSFFAVLSQKTDLYQELGKYEIVQNTLSFMHQKIVEKSHAKHPFYGFILYRKAKFLYTTAQYVDANEYAQEALEILEKQLLNTHQQVYATQQLQANIALALGQYHTARNILEQLLALQNQQLGYYHADYLENLQLLSDLYIQENKPEKALKYAEKACQYAQLNTQLSVMVQKRIYMNCHYLKGMAEPEKHNHIVWRDLENEYLLQKQYVLAIECCTKEAEIFLQGKKYDSTLKKARFSIQIIQQYTFTHNVYLAKNYHLMAKAYTFKKADSALYYYQAALEHTFTLTQEIFPYMTEHEQFTWYQKIYALLQEYQQFAVQYAPHNRQNHKKMLVFELYCKSILLRTHQKMAVYASSTDNTELKSHMEQWQHYKRELTKCFLNTGTTGIYADSIQRSITESERYIRRHFNLEQDNPFKLYTWQEIQQAIPDSSALWLNIRISVAPDSIFYLHYIVDKTTTFPRYILQKHGEDIEQNALPKYKKYIKGVFDVQEDVYHTFWKPVQDSLNGIKKVYYIPDGVYYQVNPNSIYDIEKEKYVLIDYDIYWINHVQDIASIHHKDIFSKPNAVLFGYPDYYYSVEKLVSDSTRGTLLPLPGTKTEVETIKKVLQKEGWKTTVFIEEQASENNLKKIINPTVLHIATHGFYIDRTKNKYLQKRMGISDSALYSVPLLRSGLMLAGAEKTLEGVQKTDKHEEDGILLGYEAQTLNLEDTELVTLSACETGLGTIMAGEGIFGLQRAFEMAGVKAVMTSLWNVNDNATQQLMTHFYTFWLIHQNKQKALKMAQIAVMKEYNYPYYWGAFVIVY